MNAYTRMLRTDLQTEGLIPTRKHRCNILNCINHTRCNLISSIPKTQLPIAIQSKCMHFSICHNNRVTSKKQANTAEKTSIFAFDFFQNEPSTSNSCNIASKHFGDTSHIVLWSTWLATTQLPKRIAATWKYTSFMSKCNTVTVAALNCHDWINIWYLTWITEIWKSQNQCEKCL